MDPVEWTLYSEICRDEQDSEFEQHERHSGIQGEATQG
jgi:hypothetical protein